MWGGNGEFYSVISQRTLKDVLHDQMSLSNSHSATSVCEHSANETRDNEKEEPLTMDEMPFLSLIPRQSLSDYEESSIIQEVRKELESLEEKAGLKPEPDSARDLFLGDEI